MSEYEIELYKIIGEMIREIRISKDITLEHVAAKIGVTTKTIQRYETGERKIKIDTLIALSGVLKFDYYEFMEEAKLRLLNQGKHRTNTERRLSAYYTQLTQLYYDLNKENQNKLVNYASRLLELQQIEEPVLNAAHEISNASADDIAHDNNIMNDDDF